MTLFPVNKIIDSSCVDGPGNRSVVFFQGCNFQCTYCHNPETINNCTSCGICVDICPVKALYWKDSSVRWDKSICINCDTCIRICPLSASPKIEYLSTNKIVERIEHNLPFIRGVTFSGGECMLQADGLSELVGCLSQTVDSVLLDSNGSIDFSKYEGLLASIDGVLLDMKCFDEETHIGLTGMSNEQVIKNAVYLAERGKLTEIRTVVIPSILPNRETVMQTASLIAERLPKGQKIPYKIIKFRKFGVRAIAQEFQEPSTLYMEKLQKELTEFPCFTISII